MASGPVTLNPQTIAAPDGLAVQHVAAEHDLARAYAAAVDQLAKLNELVLPVTKAEAQAVTQKAVNDLRGVRRSALTALASTLGSSAVDADTYASAAEIRLEGQRFANEAGVLLAPEVNALVTRAAQLYVQVGDAAAKELTRARGTPAPAPRP